MKIPLEQIRPGDLVTWVPWHRGYRQMGRLRQSKVVDHISWKNFTRIILIKRTRWIPGEWIRSAFRQK